MGKLKPGKVRSATLVEAIVALVIITALTGITVMIFTQVTTTGYSIRRAKAEGLIEKYLTAAMLEQTYFEEEFREDEFVVRKEIVSGVYSSNLIWLRISVSDNTGKPVQHQNILLPVK